MTWTVDHLARGLLRSANGGRAARLASFWLRYADRAAGRRFAVDAASALYFLGRRSETAITPGEIVSGYAGVQAAARPLGETGGTPSSE